MFPSSRSSSGIFWGTFLWLLSEVPVFGGNRQYVEQDTGMGMVRGYREVYQNTELDIFNSIPFAKPPIGNRRFAYPERIEPWDDVKDVTKKPPSCIQPMDGAFNRFSGVEMWNAKNKSEDCLYLTIWTPSLADRHGHREQLPVLVWIFGGGFYSGTTTLDLYDGRVLASRTGMVVVSMQYRVSTLGFMYLGASEAPGNQGLMDQVMALEWIYNRVEHFGGDRHQITLFGESAGAVSVAYHMISHSSRQLFNRAIMQSGSALCRWALEDPEASKKRYLELAEFVGCNISLPITELISCLREADPMRLSEEIFATTNNYNFVTSVLATIDGEFLTEHPKDSIAKGDFKNTDILIGSMKDEGAYFLVYSVPHLYDRWQNTSMPRDIYEGIIRTAAQSEVQIFADAIEFEYEIPYHFNNQARYRDILDDVIGDSDFICPVVKFAEIYGNAGNKIYMYHFLHDGSANPWPEWMGIMHGYEIDFVFGIPLMDGMSYPEDDRKFSERIVTYWTNFAKHGNPNPSSPRPSDWPRITWEPYTPQNKEYLQLRARDNFTMAQGMRSRQCHFWNDFMPKLEQAVLTTETDCITAGSSPLYTSGILVTITTIITLV